MRARTTVPASPSTRPRCRSGAAMRHALLAIFAAAVTLLTWAPDARA